MSINNLCFVLNLRTTACSARTKIQKLLEYRLGNLFGNDNDDVDLCTGPSTISFRDSDLGILDDTCTQNISAIHCTVCRAPSLSLFVCTFSSSLIIYLSWSRTPPSLHIVGRPIEWVNEPTGSDPSPPVGRPVAYLTPTPLPCHHHHHHHVSTFTL